MRLMQYKVTQIARKNHILKSVYLLQSIDLLNSLFDKCLRFCHVFLFLRNMLNSQFKAITFSINTISHFTHPTNITNTIKVVFVLTVFVFLEKS